MTPDIDSAMFNFALGILGNLLATALTFVLAHFTQAARRAGKSQAQVTTLACAAIGSTALAILAALWVTSKGTDLWISTLMAFLALAPLVAFMAAWLTRSTSVGIVEVNRHTRGKVGPHSLLSDSTDGFLFMGTGASKLTSQRDAFEEAVLGATRAGKSVQLLLSNPDEANLRAAAMRAKRPEDEYRKLVLDTLRFVKEIKEQRGGNVQVRFYRGVREFRLFFVGNRYVVVSYNVYGVTSAEDFPSLVLLRDQRQATRSFYWAFKTYFDREWDSAKTSRWDFNKYV